MVAAVKATAAAVVPAYKAVGYLTRFLSNLPHANRVPNIYDVALQAIQKTFASTSWVTTYSLTTKTFKVLRADPIVTTLALVAIVGAVVSGKAKQAAVATVGFGETQIAKFYNFAKSLVVKPEVKTPTATIEAQLEAARKALTQASDALHTAKHLCNISLSGSGSKLVI